MIYLVPSVLLCCLTRDQLSKTGVDKPGIGNNLWTAFVPLTNSSHYDFYVKLTVKSAFYNLPLNLGLAAISLEQFVQAVMQTNILC